MATRDARLVGYVSGHSFPVFIANYGLLLHRVIYQKGSRYADRAEVARADEEPRSDHQRMIAQLQAASASSGNDPVPSDHEEHDEPAEE